MKEEGSSNYRPDIDGLRAFAVISVIIYHFSKDLLPNGFLGVDIFFVISGYVITSSLHNSSDKNLGNFLINFYSRRVKRLAPALFFCVLIAGFLICLFNPNPHDSLKTGIASLFGFSNIYLFSVATDYFAASSDLNVFTQTWSLGVEEQFYLIFPLLLWIFGFSRLSRKIGFVWMVGVLSISSLLAFIYLSETNESAAFFLMPSRFWELGTGCLLFFLLKQKLSKTFFAKIPTFLVLGLLAASLYIPLPFKFLSTITVVFLTGLLIASLRPKTAAYNLLTHPLILYTGLISYSLYLWHWVVISISHWTVGVHWWSVPIQVVLLFLLAFVSYRYIEKPLRHAKWSSFQWMPFIYAGGVAVTVSGLLVIFAKPLDGHLYLGEKHLNITIVDSHPEITREVRNLARKCNMTPHHLSGKNYQPKPDVDSAFIRECIQSSDFPKILLIGDSFAQGPAKNLAVIARQLGYDFKMLFGYNCPYPLPFKEIDSGSIEECKEIDEMLLWREIIDALEKDDLLVIRLFFKRQYVDYSWQPNVKAYDKAISKLFNSVKEKDAKLLVIGPNPILSLRDLSLLNPQWFHLNPDADSKILPDNTPETTYYHQLDQHLQEHFDGIDSAVYFTLKPYLCDSMDICKIADRGTPLYFDRHHLTQYGYDLFYEDLFDCIARLLDEE